MKIDFISRIVLVLALVAGQFSWAGQPTRIRVDQVLFGIEYTYQDQEMVNEEGRNTMNTPHKDVKAAALAKDLAWRLGATISDKSSFKNGHYLQVPNDGQWVITKEPVTIEVNSTPRHLHEIKPTARVIFASARKQSLVPYVNPAAERSGMGHYHVGARVMAENPFYVHPLLLRNVMVYLHKRPSLLHGFAEAFDIGAGSNIETYHEEARQKEFAKAVAEFDEWYDRASPEERASQGLNQFLTALHNNNGKSDFFRHYRYVNLEHLRRAHFFPHDTGKLTVEFRGFRPPKDEDTAFAFANLLIHLMERHSEPDYKEPFQMISHDEYLRFNTASKVVADWQDARVELGLADPHLDAAIEEYADAVERFHYAVPGLEGAELYLAHSQKTEKGKFYELRLPVAKYGSQKPNIEIAGQAVTLEKVKLGQEQYWIGVIDTKGLGIEPAALRSGRVQVRHEPFGARCQAIFSRAG